MSLGKAPAMAPSLPGQVFTHDHDKDAPLIAPLPPLSQIITKIDKGEDGCSGKSMLFAHGWSWNAETECWEELLEPVCSVPALYKPGDVMPSFDGFINVYLADGSESQLFGGTEIPANMVGSIICIDGELCYLGYPPPQAIPDEVQIGGSQPGPDSEVEVWFDCGVAKIKTDAGWVQGTPYGA